MVINGRFLQRQITGVERYGREITSRLPGPARMLSPRGGQQGVRGHLWEQLVLPRLVDGERLWSPANSGPVLVSNQIVTIHDTNAVEHPEWYRPAAASWYRLLLPILARRARKILTVSHYSKQRLILSFGLDPRRVAVIYPGVNLAQFHPVSRRERTEFLRRAGLSQPYLLFVGSLSGGKNLVRLAQAWQEIAAEFPQVELVLAGREGAVFKNNFDHTPASRVRLLGSVAETDLASLYSGAMTFIMPSPWEGFGLPALEAMACGTPVIGANRGGTPEAVGEAGLLVDTLNVPCLAEAMRKVMSDQRLQLELRQCGLERAATFSWDQAAQAVYREALDLPPQKL